MTEIEDVMMRNQELTMQVQSLTERFAKAEGEKQSLTTQLEMFDDWFCCPECASYQIKGISFDDDFGSHKCDDCGHCGEPGEDFPTTSKMRERLKKAEAVVEKLPVTADGVRVVHGDSVYEIKHKLSLDKQSLRMVRTGEVDFIEHEYWDHCPHCECECAGVGRDEVSRYYSTIEAAKAALAARSEGGM